MLFKISFGEDNLRKFLNCLNFQKTIIIRPLMVFNPRGILVFKGIAGCLGFKKLMDNFFKTSYVMI